MFKDTKRKDSRILAGWRKLHEAIIVSSRVEKKCERVHSEKIHESKVYEWLLLNYRRTEISGNEIYYLAQKSSST